jgi:Glycosyl hydrolase family 79 C-terminal beta domain
VRSDRGHIALTVVNKEPVCDSVVRAKCPGVRTASVIRLTAPSISTTDGVALGGAAVDNGGKWAPNTVERSPVVDGEIEIAVPAASAAIVWLR